MTNTQAAFDPSKSEGSSSIVEELGMFGHHPDLSIDFCIEIDKLEGWITEIAAGLRSEWPFWGCLSRLMKFARERRAELDEDALRALPVLAGLERKLLSTPRQPTCLDERYNKHVVRFAR